MAGVPYVFASATTSIPLSQLDADFNTPVTIGNTTVGLGNTVTSFGNVTLTNATISGNLTATSITGGTANGVVYLSSGNVVTANPTVLDFDGNNLGVGVTPSAWGSTWKGIQFKSSPNFLSGGTDLNLIANAYNDGTNYKYIDSYSYASRYYQYNGQHQWHTTQSTQGANNTISFTQAMTLNNSGYLQVLCSSASDAGNLIFQAYGSAASADALSAYAVLYGTGYANSANSAVKVGKANSTNRSINAAGTVNASGADYAEYMIKAGDFTINKGDICGIDVNGKLTNVFANAISFVVKSTDPSYVGGDKWGSAEVLGLTKPTAPTRGENESDADWATAETNYQTALTAYEAQLTIANENARQMVDRIAFSGQVPVNVTGATAGQYIVPVANQDGSIGGQAVSESAMTLQQYMQSVGKVISVVGNVTTIIVKVA